MTQIFTPVCSITSTRRRRFLWAAWWTAPPESAPFRRPDASSGGARSREEALRQAERAAGRPLVEIEGRWARAWARILVGEKPWTGADRSTFDEGPVPPRRAPRAPVGSVWELLGVEPKASVEEIRRAFRRRALAAHPDQGGDADRFRALRRAYDEALRRRRRESTRPSRSSKPKP